MDFEVWNTAQGISGITVTTGIQNPSSADKECDNQHLTYGIPGVELIQNPKLSYIPLHGALLIR